MDVRRLAIMGSTGSIGKQTLDIVRAFPDELSVIALSAGTNEDLLAQQIEEFTPRSVYLTGHPLDAKFNGVPVVSMEQIVQGDDVDLVVMGISGSPGLIPTLAALKTGRPLALANKEVIVMAGQLLMNEARKSGSIVLPLDSEPNAIWQCLIGEKQEASRLIITASGGALRTLSAEELENVSPEQALKHPTWAMGQKITIDSASLMNKAFEVIECHCLFDVPWEQIEVIIHHQSIIHSMVEFPDGTVKAALSTPDMRLPIQYALFYPERRTNYLLPRFNPVDTGALTFQGMDPSRYPCFTMALEAAYKGGTYLPVLNAADEIAVELFLNGSIGFMDIGRVVSETLNVHESITEIPTIDGILEADSWSRTKALQIAKGLMV